MIARLYSRFKLDPAMIFELSVERFTLQVWGGPLEGGSFAIVVVNRSVKISSINQSIYLSIHTYTNRNKYIIAYTHTHTHICINSI